MANPIGTGQARLDSDLERKRWVREGLLQKAATSFWAPYKGQSKDNIIMTVNNSSADAGHTVVFDMRGKLEGRPVRGKDTAQGTGQTKKKFSDKITVDRYRWVVDNGDKFDGKAIGDLRIHEHADSVSLLGDQWIRAADQGYFDIAQQTSEFGINLGNKFTFDKLLECEYACKMGEGFTSTPAGIKRRLPLDPFRTSDGRPVWLMLIDTAMKLKLFNSTDGAQSFLTNVDVRGNNNRLISGVIGKIGSFLVIEAPSFFGYSDSDIIDANQFYNYNSTATYSAGLRQYLKDTADANKGWTGDADWDANIGSVTPGGNIKKISRGLILGAGAFQFAMGKEPDYKWQPSTDFSITSESCLEVWCGLKPTKLYAENEDYRSVNVAGYNYGSVFIDLEV